MTNVGGRQMERWTRRIVGAVVVLLIAAGAFAADRENYHVTRLYVGDPAIQVSGSGTSLLEQLNGGTNTFTRINEKDSSLGITIVATTNITHQSDYTLLQCAAGAGDGELRLQGDGIITATSNLVVNANTVTLRNASGGGDSNLECNGNFVLGVVSNMTTECSTNILRGAAGNTDAAMEAINLSVIARTNITVRCATLFVSDTAGTSHGDISSVAQAQLRLAAADRTTAGAGTSLTLTGSAGLTAGAGGDITATAGTAAGTSTGGDLSLNAGTGATTGAGGYTTLVGGTGGANGDGGVAEIRGGRGGASAGAGANVRVYGGRAYANNEDGGDVDIAGGLAHSAGEDGTIYLKGYAIAISDRGGDGDGTVTSPNLTMTMATNLTVNADAIIASDAAGTGAGTIQTVAAQTLSLASTSAGASGNGPELDITAGNAHTSGTGGPIDINAGTGAANTGGGITITAGACASGNGAGGTVDIDAGDAAGSGNNAGGNVQIDAGDGANTSGTGGNVSIAAGTGGSNGDGGPIAITAGSGGASAGDGGNITLTAGNSPAATDGNVIVNALGLTVSDQAGTGAGSIAAVTGQELSIGGTNIILQALNVRVRGLTGETDGIITSPNLTMTMATNLTVNADTIIASDAAGTGAGKLTSVSGQTLSVEANAATLLIGPADATKIEMADAAVETEVQGTLEVIEEATLVKGVDRSLYLEYYEEFLDIAGTTEPQPWATDLETSCTADYMADEPCGVHQIATTAADQADAGQLTWGNDLKIDMDKDPIITFRVRVDGVADLESVEKVIFGVCPDHTNAEDALDNIDDSAWFMLKGDNDLNIYVEGDDGTTDNDDRDSGVDIVDDTWTLLQIDFSSLADVKFYIDGVEQSYGTINMAASAGTVVQPIILIQRTSNAGTEAAVGVETDFCHINVDR
jgi:hypothetical protein